MFFLPFLPELLVLAGINILLVFFPEFLIRGCGVFGDFLSLLTFLLFFLCLSFQFNKFLPFFFLPLFIFQRSLPVLPHQIVVHHPFLIAHCCEAPPGLRCLPPLFFSGGVCFDTLDFRLNVHVNLFRGWFLTLSLVSSLTAFWQAGRAEAGLAGLPVAVAA